MKKTVVLVGICLLLLGTITFGENNYDAFADDLKALGLFKGTANGYELDRAPSRVEGAAMLLRLLGKEEEALKAGHTHPFKDVPNWASPYVGYMYEKGLTKGLSATTFGSNDLLDAKSYMTFVLRALNYDDSKGDFAWASALDFASTMDLITPIEAEQIQNKGFLRGNMVWMSHQALWKSLKGQNQTLQEKLLAEGAISKTLQKAATLKAKFDPVTGWYGYVDGQMNWIIPPVFSYAEDFSEGFAFVHRPSGAYTGYIDTSGKNVLGQQFVLGTPFKNGRALVNRYAIKAEDWQIALIDGKGTVVKAFDRASNLYKDEDFHDLIYYADLSGRYYFAQNNEPLPWRVMTLLTSYEGIGVAQIEAPGSKYGYSYGLFDMATGKSIHQHVSKDGQKFVFEEITFSEGIFKVKILVDGIPKYVFYNKALKPLNQEIYHQAEAFKEGLAVVGLIKHPTHFNREIRYAYLNKDGSYFTGFDFERATSFYEGYAVVDYLLESRAMNRKGELIGESKLVLVPGTWFTESEHAFVAAEAKRVVDQIIKPGMSTRQKVVAINAYLVDWVVYDHGNFSYEIDDRVPRTSYTAFGALKYRIAVCSGYAEAAKWLMDLSGIESKVLYGTVKDYDGKEIGHAWNLVNVDGKWLHLDVTWNDGASGAIEDPYLLITDQEMLRIGKRTW